MSINTLNNTLNYITPKRSLFQQKNCALTQHSQLLYKLVMDFLTTKEVAERLGVKIRMVQLLVQSGRLPAMKFGRDYMIKEADLKLVKDRKIGRPPTKKKS